MGLQPGLNDLLDKDGILPACLKADATFLGECDTRTVLGIYQLMAVLRLV